MEEEEINIGPKWSGLVAGALIAVVVLKAGMLGTFCVFLQAARLAIEWHLIPDYFCSAL